MNILILSWRDTKHPHAGGAEQATMAHARAWERAGNDVTWFTSSFDDAKKSEAINNIEIIRRGSQLGGVHILAFFWYMFSKHIKYDLVVDQFHGIPFFTPLYMRVQKLAYIHEATKEVWTKNHLPFLYKYLYAIVGKIIEPFIFILFYQKINFMTVSESTKQDLLTWKIPEYNIHIIKNGFTRPVEENKYPKNNIKTIIYLGALARDKGVEDALEVFSLLQKRNGKIQFWMVGKGDPVYAQKLNNLADKLEIKNVKFWGHVSDKKKFDLLGRSHVLVNPSVREGWGLVNIESNFMKTPVVAYNVPGIRDSVRQNMSGLLCKNTSPDCLANEITTLLKNEKKLKRLSISSRKWAEQFSWKQAGQESLKLVNAMVKKQEFM